MNNDIERELGRLSVLAERAERDRAEILQRISGVETQLTTLNGRTRKLEDDNNHSKMIWQQVADLAVPVEELRKQMTAMREPFQIVSSGLRYYQVWRWRILFLILLGFSAGNQALRVIFDYGLKEMAMALGIMQ